MTGAFSRASPKESLGGGVAGVLLSLIGVGTARSYDTGMAWVLILVLSVLCVGQGVAWIRHRGAREDGGLSRGDQATGTRSQRRHGPGLP